MNVAIVKHGTCLGNAKKFPDAEWSGEVTSTTYATKRKIAEFSEDN